MLNIGWGWRVIVPERPALLQGQMHTRIAREALDPLTVTAMVLRNGDDAQATVILSFDLAMVAEGLCQAVRERVARQTPALPPQNIIMAATHTHTSLVHDDGFYKHPGGDVMTAKECETFLADRAAQAVAEAWASLAPASVGRAFGHAVVAHNRRPAYRDGTSRMYGRADQEDFIGIEGSDDHTMDMLFVWNRAGALTGVMLDIPCPSQVDEHLDRFSADFWHEIRVELRRRLGERLFVLPLCGPAGDQSPHFILEGKQEEEMRKRRGLSERQEIAVRVANEVERALACTGPMAGDLVLAHTVKHVELPPRRVSRQESDWAREAREQALKRFDPQSWWPQRLGGVVDTFEGRHVPGPVPVELHFLRIGDAVLATSPFELYVDYSQRIKARSAAAQTFLSQITNGTGLYLPSARAVQGGGYGAMPVVCIVGPEGGDELVEHTVKGIAALFANQPAAVG